MRRVCESSYAVSVHLFDRAEQIRQSVGLHRFPVEGTKPGLQALSLVVGLPSPGQAYVPRAPVRMTCTQLSQDVEAAHARHLKADDQVRIEVDRRAHGLGPSNAIDVEQPSSSRSVPSHWAPSTLSSTTITRSLRVASGV